MPYINVNDAYILDNTGKQVDDAVDYALANSNRNLLDNPFFSVNQRNFTTSTGVNNIYSVDRWYIARGTGTISKTSNGITINGVGASRETTFQQMIDCGDLTGRTVTVSVNDGGTIRQITGTVPARTTSNNIFIRFTLRGGVSAFLYAMATSSAYAYMLQFQVNAGYTIDLRAVKLEIGSYSTLANDVSPDYGEELRKCRFYYRRYANPLAGGMSTITGGTAISATAADFTDNEPMYGGNAGTLAYNGAVQVNGVAVTGKTLYSRSDGKISQNTMRFNVSGGLTAYGSALINLGANSYIELSHDL